MTPNKAFKEIERVLKPGGAHVFTVPWYHTLKNCAKSKNESRSD